ncbi:MAG TPA: endopeptidase La [Oscillospiraceae bacterium]|nr:endopeptidase La [Oscillospiraceae bacterium]
MKKTEPITAALPIVAMRGVVIFPNMTLHFDVGRKKSIAALKAALNSNREIFLVAQKDLSDEEPKMQNLYSVGVVSEVRHLMKLPNSNNVRVAVEGKYRATLEEIIENNLYLSGTAVEKRERLIKSTERDYEEALTRGVKEIFENYASMAFRLPPDMTIAVMSEKRISKLTDYIAGNVPLPLEEKQTLLNELNPLKRGEMLCNMLARETELLELETDIHARVQESVDKNQREYYLREQLKVISNELSEDDSPSYEADKYRKKIASLKMAESSKDILYAECDRLMKSTKGSPDASVIRTYLDRCIALPWGKTTKDRLNIKRAKQILDKDHFGLTEVKERIIEMLSVRRLVPDMKSQIICLLGPPGVGKTSIARSLSEAMGRRYVRVSLGGVSDEAEIRGHRKTYIGSMPGRIITAIEKAKSSNPLMLFDEIDKLGNSYKGDPSSALLEVLDAEQNYAFTDHYIEIPFDLSQVLFVTTANDLSDVPAALVDRMEIIELYSYTSQEKFSIAKKHLFPKQLKLHGMKKSMLNIKDDAINAVIDGYTKEAGVRTLERTLATICRKAAAKIAEGHTGKIMVTTENLNSFLGAVKYKKDVYDTLPMDGAANGLAWTRVGGEMMQIEVAVLDGKGKIELTGSLGDVMKESAKAAISYIRANAAALSISSDFYKNKDIHIHAPEGAVPKDGPSAGVTMATALVSALAGKTVKPDVAMTGEITLRGAVLPIGGLREKATAAYKAGIKTVIIPYENEPDIDKIDEQVKEFIKFVPVRTLNEVFNIALNKISDSSTIETQLNESAPDLTSLNEEDVGKYVI